MNGASLKNPICSDGKFIGTLDGDGHKVYNFSIDGCDSNGNMGLFAFNAGTIKNLQIGDNDSQVQITANSNKVSKSAGAIAGANSGNIINCKVVNVNVYCMKDIDSSNSASMKVGGICGTNTGSVQRCVVLNSSLKAEGYAKDSWVDAYAGGICGYFSNEINEATSGTSNITDCYVFNTSVTARAGVNDNMFVWRTATSVSGTIVGGMQTGKIAYCVEGVVILTSTSTTNFGSTVETRGGFIGRNSTSNNPQNCVSALDNGKYITLINTDSSYNDRETANGEKIWTQTENGDLELAFSAKA